MDVFMLYHIYEQKDDFGVHDEEKLIGIFPQRPMHRERSNI